MFSYSRFIHHYDKSAFKYTEPISEDYRVFVNGEEIPVYTCRISQYPFNRVWPGHQRPFNQSEPASFVNIVSDEELRIEVIANRPYERVLIKPYAKGIAHEERDGKISFTLRENGQFVLQTDSYHRCLYLFNSKPIVCEDKEAVTHYFGPGVHMPGKITLSDNESVYLDKDALVFGCIYAENAKNIRVFGNGLFDDTSEERVDMNCYEPFTNGNIKFYDCEDIKVEGVLFRNSAIWCVNLFHCFRAEIDNIKVFGQWRYNTDGVDIMNSKDITIKNSFIHSFDDTVTIKGIDRYADTDNENIVTENCVLWCDWGRTCEIGFETACRRYRNIVFRNCDILRGGDSALDIQNGDCAEVSDILFENISVEYNAFDTPAMMEDDEHDTYTRQDEIAIPYLIKISNYRFRNEANCKEWNIPMDMQTVINLDGIQCGGVHDVTCRNIAVYYDERIPLAEGKFNVPIDITSHLEGVQYENISISGVTVNGVKLDMDHALISAENIRNFSFTVEEDPYAEGKKNTVPAKNQLKGSELVFFENPDGKGKRILFVGNSITLHGVKEELGWLHTSGMAASSMEKDYVHRLMARVREKEPDAAVCICQAAAWERRYEEGEATYSLYEAARAFDADIIVMRIVENCTYDHFRHEIFQKEYGKLIKYLDRTGKAKVIITTGFWDHPGDSSIRAFAQENNLPLITLGDLGADDKMKAIGLFSDAGVANHPGDLGMKAIADRIYEVMQYLL